VLRDSYIATFANYYGHADQMVGESVSGWQPLRCRLCFREFFRRCSPQRRRWSSYTP